MTFPAPPASSTPAPENGGTEYHHLRELLGQVVEIAAVEYIDDGVPIIVIADGRKFFASGEWIEQCASVAHAELQTGTRPRAKVEEHNGQVGLGDAT